MADTGQSINYNLRFAKHVERKMLCDAFLKVAPFADIKEYQYVGFGSFYFTDFTLFHKRLGMKEMISIEADLNLRVRCRKNKPFECIKLKPGTANDVLHEADFPWQKRTVLWLDYDKALQSDYLNDVGFVCPRLTSGSIVLVTVNAHPGAEKGRVERLEERLEEQYIPVGVKSSDLAGWGTAKVYRSAIDSVIRRVLADKFAVKPLEDRLIYQQLFNFHYSDGAPMLTVGGILFNEGQRALLEQCQFGDLPFVRKREDPFLVDIPRLTYREMRSLDKFMPRLSNVDNETGGTTTLLRRVSNIMGIPPDDIKRYASMYRFFPTFVDADF